MKKEMIFPPNGIDMYYFKVLKKRIKRRINKIKMNNIVKE